MVRGVIFSGRLRVSCLEDARYRRIRVETVSSPGQLSNARMHHDTGCSRLRQALFLALWVNHERRCPGVPFFSGTGGPGRRVPPRRYDPGGAVGLAAPAGVHIFHPLVFYHLGACIEYNTDPLSARGPFFIHTIPGLRGMHRRRSF